MVTPDELTIVFTSDRMGPGTHGGLDMWIATRSSTAEDFGPPLNLHELNSPRTEGPTWISPDGCRLYFDQATPTGQGVFVASRPH